MTSAERTDGISGPTQRIAVSRDAAVAQSAGPRQGRRREISGPSSGIGVASQTCTLASRPQLPTMKDRRWPSGLKERLFAEGTAPMLREDGSRPFVEKVSSSLPSARSQSLTSGARVGELSEEASRLPSGLTAIREIGAP